MRTPLPIAGHVDDVAAAAVYLARRRRGSSPAPRSTSTAATSRPAAGSAAADGTFGTGVEHRMKFGVALGRLNPRVLPRRVASRPSELGYESVWLPEHLVFTAAMSRSPHPGEDAPAGPARDADLRRVRVPRRSSPARTDACGSGTHVYNIGLRHPFVAARAVQTLDIVSGGRVEFGVGASWLEEEWIAAELDFATPRPARRRGDRGLPAALDRAEVVVPRRALQLRRRGVRAEAGAAAGPADRRRRRVGRRAAPRRARSATAGSAWATRSSRRRRTIERLRARARRERSRRRRAFRGVPRRRGRVAPPTSSAGRRLGVTRLIVSPWRRSPDAIDGLRAFADASSAWRPRS